MVTEFSSQFRCKDLDLLSETEKIFPKSSRGRDYYSLRNRARAILAKERALVEQLRAYLTQARSWSEIYDSWYITVYDFVMQQLWCQVSGLKWDSVVPFLEVLRRQPRDQPAVLWVGDELIRTIEAELEAILNAVYRAWERKLSSLLGIPFPTFPDAGKSS